MHWNQCIVQYESETPTKGCSSSSDCAGWHCDHAHDCLCCCTWRCAGAEDDAACSGAARHAVDSTHCQHLLMNSDKLVDKAADTIHIAATQALLHHGDESFHSLVVVSWSVYIARLLSIMSQQHAE